MSVQPMNLTEADARPLFVVIFFGGRIVGIAVARDILTTDYPEPED